MGQYEILTYEYTLKTSCEYVYKLHKSRIICKHNTKVSPPGYFWLCLRITWEKKINNYISQVCYVAATKSMFRQLNTIDITGESRISRSVDSWILKMVL